jgi:hypothetical protein
LIPFNIGGSNGWLNGTMTPGAGNWNSPSAEKAIGQMGPKELAKNDIMTKIYRKSGFLIIYISMSYK